MQVKPRHISIIPILGYGKKVFSILQFWNCQAFFELSSNNRENRSGPVPGFFLSAQSSFSVNNILSTRSVNASGRVNEK